LYVIVLMGDNQLILDEKYIKNEIYTSIKGTFDDRPYVEYVTETLMRDGSIERSYTYSGWWLIFKEKSITLVLSKIHLKKNNE